MFSDALVGMAAPAGDPATPAGPSQGQAPAAQVMPLTCIQDSTYTNARFELQIPNTPQMYGACRLRILAAAVHAAHQDVRLARAHLGLVQGDPQHNAAPGAVASAAVDYAHKKQVLQSVAASAHAVLGTRLLHAALKQGVLFDTRMQIAVTMSRTDPQSRASRALLQALDVADRTLTQSSRPYGVQAYIADLDPVVAATKLTCAAHQLLPSRDSASSARTAVGGCEVCQCERADTECWHAKPCWQTNEDAIIDTRRQEAVASERMDAFRGEAAATCEAVLHAHKQSTSELRFELLRFMVTRLVDQNFALIKPRLWRPQGRLVQSARIAACSEEAV